MHLMYCCSKYVILFPELWGPLQYLWNVIERLHGNLAASTYGMTYNEGHIPSVRKLYCDPNNQCSS